MRWHAMGPLEEVDRVSTPQAAGGRKGIERDRLREMRLDVVGHATDRARRRSSRQTSRPANRSSTPSISREIADWIAKGSVSDPQDAIGRQEGSCESARLPKGVVHDRPKGCGSVADVLGQGAERRLADVDHVLLPPGAVEGSARMDVPRVHRDDGPGRGERLDAPASDRVAAARDEAEQVLGMSMGREVLAHVMGRQRIDAGSARAGDALEAADVRLRWRPGLQLHVHRLPRMWPETPAASGVSSLGEACPAGSRSPAHPVWMGHGEGRRAAVLRASRGGQVLTLRLE